MTTPPLDLPALKEIANAATPGPWEAYDSNEGMDRAYSPMWCVANEEFHNPTTGDDEDWMGVEIHVGDKADSDHIATFDPPTMLALLDELDKAKRACQTLGRVIDRQCEDALTATDSQDLLWGDDGDGDWGAIWERVLGLGEKAREAIARAEAAEKQVAAAREIAHRLHSDYYLADVITESIDRADNIANELDVALDTHTPETETP